jgi:hypothetical protein
VEAMGHTLRQLHLYMAVEQQQQQQQWQKQQWKQQWLSGILNLQQDVSSQDALPQARDLFVD